MNRINTNPQCRAPDDRVARWPLRPVSVRRRPGGLAAGMVFVLLLLGGCAQYGPQALTEGRPQYNVAVQQTEAQQLLLNIVRNRYNDPILFLDVTSISTGFSREVNGNLLGSFSSGNNSGVGSLGGKIGENPFIFYAPNTGEKFVRQMLTPLDLRTIALILQSGWSIERVMLLLGESANQLYNQPGGDSSSQQHNLYLQVADALRNLQRNRQLIVGLEPSATEGESNLILIITPEAIESDPYLIVCNSIGVACDGEPIRLRQGFGAAADGNTLALATRSWVSARYQLSRHVDAPRQHVEAGFASRGQDLSANTSAGAALRELFHVRSAAEEPENASVKIFYRDAWFYIADADRDSKTTFALLSLLITLQSATTTGVMPLITLPAS
jgi:hypothetical protein